MYTKIVFTRRHVVPVHSRPVGTDGRPRSWKPGGGRWRKALRNCWNSAGAMGAPDRAP